VGAARILRDAVLKEASNAVRDGADRVASRRARRILYGSVAAAFLGTLVFTALFYVAVRERRAAEERVRRAEVLAGLGTLAAGVAHEVNNPLGTIAACADAALGKVRSDRPDPERAASLLETIGSEARRCARIVKDLMDLGRDGAPAAGPVDLPGLVRETVELARLNPRMKRVPIEVTPGEQPPLLMADAARLKQALLNLLANAVEVSPDGSRVEVAVVRDGEGAAVTVRDRGPGVPEADRRRIFEPFRSMRPGGTGLGLTVVDRVATSHGGSIEVEDAPGGGALFRLRLPARASKD
jgi:signal transduction histidine kinase